MIRGGESMAGFVQGIDREQVTFFPARLDADGGFISMSYAKGRRRALLGNICLVRVGGEQLGKSVTSCT